MFWTDKLYNEAYDIIKDRKFPIVIPSYNCPNPEIFKKLLIHDSNFNYPIYIFIRKSQREQYEENLKDYIKLITVDDNIISNAGLARRYIINWSRENNFSHVFMLDDDITNIEYRVLGKSKSCKDISVPASNHNIYRIIAMWQLSVEYAERNIDNLAISGILPYYNFSWLPSNVDKNISLYLYKRIQNAVCLNINILCDNNINYISNDECGHEDTQILIDCLENNLCIGIFQFLVYSSLPMSLRTFSNFGSTMRERFYNQAVIMHNNHKNKPYIKFDLEREIAEVIIDYRKYCSLNGIRNRKLDIFKENC